MRKGREYELGIRQWRIVMRDELHIRASETRTLAASLVSRCERELQPRMAGNEGAELAAGVPARTKDSNRDSMHN